MATTKWINPTAHTMRATLAGEEVVFPPGEVVEVDSRHSAALRVLHGCGHRSEPCFSTGKCHRQSEAQHGTVVGGICPALLLADGQKYAPYTPKAAAAITHD